MKSKQYPFWVAWVLRKHALRKGTNKKVCRWQAVVRPGQRCLRGPRQSGSGARGHAPRPQRRPQCPRGQERNKETPHSMPPPPSIKLHKTTGGGDPASERQKKGCWLTPSSSPIDSSNSCQLKEFEGRRGGPGGCPRCWAGPSPVPRPTGTEAHSILTKHQTKSLRPKRRWRGQLYRRWRTQGCLCSGREHDPLFPGGTIQTRPPLGVRGLALEEP